MFFTLQNTKEPRSMKDKRILYVSSEVVPYLPETEISSMSFEAPNGQQTRGTNTNIHASVWQYQ